MLFFSPDAHEMLRLARKEADRLHHQYVGTEHLLLGMVRVGKGTVYEILRGFIPDMDEFCSAIERGMEADRKGACSGSPYSERFQRTMALASLEAAELNNSFVGSEHLLLGLLREGGGHAATVLQRFGGEIGQLRRSIVV